LVARGSIEGVSGWAIGNDAAGAGRAAEQDRRDAFSLYEKLEQAVAPCFYREPNRFAEIRRQAIALNASYFNTQRMLQEYVTKAYFG
jgi:starch phosphorylase